VRTLVALAASTASYATREAFSPPRAHVPRLFANRSCRAVSGIRASGLKKRLDQPIQGREVRNLSRSPLEIKPFTNPLRKAAVSLM
jgi:hypothetical protein